MTTAKKQQFAPSESNRDPKRLALGSVYTPLALADWAAQLLVRSLRRKKGIVLDPACGDGALLAAVSRLDRNLRLVGVDIDKGAIKQAARIVPGATTFVAADALVPSKFSNLVTAWNQLLPKKGAIGIIANPPWGAQLSHSRTELQAVGYKLAHGQFDSFDLFVELSLKLVQAKGSIVLIVPDSIFQPEHQSLRKILCNEVSIQLIARLGEGFFDNVYRGTAVLVLKNEKPSAKTKTTCVRLNKQWRAEILTGEQTLVAAEKTLAHIVPQSRFQKDAHCRFDIDLEERERASVSLIERHVDGWTNWLESSRGVELSKSGAILYCPNCAQAQPLPRTEARSKCSACDHRFLPKSALLETIVVRGKSPTGDWKPLIVGEDVDRYCATPSRHIKLGVSGINYKTDDNFRGRKILIRKTGVGIKAAIDNSEALTNQVVFIYKLNEKKRPPAFLLDYFLGVLCSRIMLAYYLKKRGENEWRSHPYLTQRIVSELPVPNIQEGTWQWSQARAIAMAVQNLAKSRSLDADIQVDRLVAGLFDLTDVDCHWALSVLDQAQALEPIRTLRVAELSSLRPVRVLG